MLARLRWSLARSLSPVPIMVDPDPGQDGAFVFVRQGQVQMSIRLSRLRMKSTTPFRRYEYNPAAPFKLDQPVAFRRLVGIVG